MKIVSFDIGIRNFAFCVENIDNKTEFPLKPTKKYYDENGCPTGEYKEYIDKIYSIGKNEICDKIDIQDYCTKNNIKDTYLGLTFILNQYSKLWDTVDVFLIEQQMSYGKDKSNIVALRLAQHCISYFYTIYGPFKIIQEFSSSHKTRILGCPHEKRKKHKTRKIFSVDLVKQILQDRKDPIYDQWKTYQKKDDISDCILMNQAFKVLHL